MKTKLWALLNAVKFAVQCWSPILIIEHIQQEIKEDYGNEKRADIQAR
jgi:hypothetical protein